MKGCFICTRYNFYIFRFQDFSVFIIYEKREEEERNDKSTCKHYFAKKCVSFPENVIFQILIKVSDMPTAVIKLPLFSADPQVRLILPFSS